MNSMLQDSNPFDFPPSSDAKYLGRERSYSNSSLSANDLPFSSSRQYRPVTTGASGPPLALPAHSSLELNSHPLLHETVYPSNPQLLLSPPDSTSGSASASCNSTSSCLAYALPKPFASNAGTSDQYATVPGSAFSSSWNEAAVTVLDRRRPSGHPPPLSPPLPYTSSQAIGSALLANRSAAMDRFQPPYSTRGGSTSPGFFQAGGPRYPSTPYPRTPTTYSLPTPDSQSPMGTIPPTYHDSSSPARPEGPPFGDTQVLSSLITGRGEQLWPEITASIHKGFFQVDNKWTCYRRNYFNVWCAFGFKNSVTPEDRYFLLYHGQHVPVQYFAVAISAKTAAMNSGESETRGLVQYTPKRDKESESVPGKHLVQPMISRAMSVNGTFAGPNHAYTGAPHISPGMMGSYPPYDPGLQSIPTQYTFERIQFQKATANNGKRRAQQQYFHVVVELFADISRNGGEKKWVLIATKQSDPMVVRGRSPGHYKDATRRDPQSGIDPDQGTGPGAENGSGMLSMAAFGHPSLDWTSPHRGGSHYAGATYRQALASQNSPSSPASSTNLSGSPGIDAEFPLSDSPTVKSSSTYSEDQSALTPLSDGLDDAFFGPDRRLVSMKRSFEDESAEAESLFSQHPTFGDSLASSSTFDSMLMPRSKVLCASS